MPSVASEASANASTESTCRRTAAVTASGAARKGGASNKHSGKKVGFNGAVSVVVLYREPKFLAEIACDVETKKITNHSGLTYDTNQKNRGAHL